MPDLPPHTSVKTYSSDFPTDENPVSEGGIWINGLKEGIDWADCVVSNGRIHGGPTRMNRRRSAPSRPRSAPASMTTPPRRRATTTIPTAVITGRVGLEPVRQGHRRRRQPDRRVVPGGRDPAPHVIEPNWCRGYEIFFRCLKDDLGYAEIVRWNGKIKDWTSLQKHVGPKYRRRDRRRHRGHASAT